MLYLLNKYCCRMCNDVVLLKELSIIKFDIRLRNAA